MIQLRKKSRSNQQRSVSRTRFIPIGMIMGGPAGGILSAVVSNWKIILFGVLIGFIVYQNTVSFEILRPFGIRTIPGLTSSYEKKLEKAENEVRIAKEQVIECDLSRERLKGAIEATNKQVEKWAALSKRLQEDQGKMSEQLIALSKQSDVEIEAILKEPTPKTCAGAIKLLRNAVTKGELQWRK